MDGIWKDSCCRGVPRDVGLRPHFWRFTNHAVQDPHHFVAEFSVLRQSPLSRRQQGTARGICKHAVMPGQSAGHVISRSKTTKQSSVSGHPARHSSPRTPSRGSGNGGQGRPPLPNRRHRRPCRCWIPAYAGVTTNRMPVPSKNEIASSRVPRDSQ